MGIEIRDQARIENRSKSKTKKIKLTDFYTNCIYFLLSQEQTLN